ncbi:MAG: hypothetical protein ABI988_15395 [Nitrospirota bacterium]
MLFDPEAEKTREKIYALAWKTLTPAIQAQRQVLVEAAGLDGLPGAALWA